MKKKKEIKFTLDTESMTAFIKDMLRLDRGLSWKRETIFSQLTISSDADKEKVKDNISTWIGEGSWRI